LRKRKLASSSKTESDGRQQADARPLIANVRGKMIRRAAPIVLGIALYAGLTFAAYSAQVLSHSGPYAGWYVNGEHLLKALAAVGPGFAAAWFYGQAGFRVGTIPGIVGVLIEGIVVLIVLDVPESESPGTLVFYLVASALAAGLTNGIAGIAAEALRKRRLLSNSTIEGDGRQQAVARPSL
jgi:hypothetical protein